MPSALLSSVTLRFTKSKFVYPIFGILDAGGGASSSIANPRIQREA